MKLNQYLFEKSLTDEAFAAFVGTDRSTVTRWKLGTVPPSPANLVKIYAATHGQVTPNDFHDLPTIQTERARA